MLRMGKVVSVNYGENKVDVLLDQGSGIVYGCHVLSWMASTSTGAISLPILKTINNRTGGVVDHTGNVEQVLHVYKLENESALNPDLEDPTTNYVYALIGATDKSMGQTKWVCLGFFCPDRNQIMFDPDNINPNLEDYVKKEIPKLAGATLVRTNSDVYSVTDIDGNFEWVHPNGTFFRIAETPTLEQDGAVHVDLTNSNKRALMQGNPTNMAWKTNYKKGLDGSLNKDRKVYAHFEVVTEKGTVVIDINKTTGNVTIKTPSDGNGSSSDNNQVSIIAGGNVTIQSVAGDATIQSVKGRVNVDGKTAVTLKTDSAKNNSIVIGPNSSHLDNLLLYKTVADKFNSHKHLCMGTGKQTSTSDKQIDTSDATSVTRAG